MSCYNAACFFLPSLKSIHPVSSFEFSAAALSRYCKITLAL